MFSILIAVKVKLNGSISCNCHGYFECTLTKFQYVWLNIFKNIFSPTMITEDDDDDNEEPLLSGFGDVSKECSGTELDSWSQVLCSSE